MIGNSRAAFPPNQFNGTILYSANQTVDFSLEIHGYDPRVTKPDLPGAIYVMIIEYNSFFLRL
jgi:hypothetical protein